MAVETRSEGAGARRAAYLLLAALGAYLLVLAFCFHPTGGLRGEYYIAGTGEEELLIHERIDRDIDFPVPQRLDAAYIFNWDIERHGFPATMPPFSIRWSGLLVVPESGIYGFSVEAQGEIAMSLDGVPLEIRPDALTERRLSAGLHPISLAYRLFEGDAKLVLRWQPPGRALVPIRSRYLAVDGAAVESGRSRRTWGWILLALFVLPLGAIVLGARSTGSRAEALRTFLSTQRPLLALGAILILAAVLRTHDYALVPFHHETADEYQHAWEGWFLLNEGEPRAWSTFPDLYPMDQAESFRWFGDHYVLVRPYFDHPPLFSVLVGLVTSLGGAPGFLYCTLPAMRLVPIALSLLGLLLLHRLAIAYGVGQRAALLSCLVYAVLPPLVMAHRLVKGESLLALLFMGALLLVEGREGGSLRRAVAVGVLCGLAVWTKATGLAVLASVLVILLSRRRHREAVTVTAVVAASVGLYLLYAWAYDFGIFIEVLRAQASTKWISLDAFLDLLGGKVVVKWFGRGWYLWLMLAVGVVAFRKERRLLLPLAIYATLIALTADHRVIYGWYRIPMLPFLCVAAGIYLDDMFDEADLYRVFPFAVTATATGLLYALPEGLAKSQGAVALFAAVALGPFLLRQIVERPFTARLARAGTLLIFLIFLFTSVATVGGLLEIYSATRGIQ